MRLARKLFIAGSVALGAVSGAALAGAPPLSRATRLQPLDMTARLGQTASVRARLTTVAGQPVGGAPVRVYLMSENSVAPLASVVTDRDGYATVSLSLVPFTFRSTGTYTLGWEFTGWNRYEPAIPMSTLTVK